MKDSQGDDSTERIQRIIDDAALVIEQAEQALEAGERMFSQHNLSAKKLKELIRRRHGEHAVAELEAKAEREAREIWAKAEQTVQQMQFDQLPQRRPRRPRDLV